MKKAVSIIIAGCVMFITGCQTTGDQQSKAVWEGIGLGAAGGAVVGQLIGKDTKSTLIGAGIGAAVGGIISYEYSNRLLAERGKLKDREDDLDARLDYAKAVNKETKQYNAKTKQQIAKLETEIETATAQKKDLSKINKELEKANKKIEKDKQVLTAEVADLKEYQKTLAGSRHPRSKIAYLNAQIKELEEQLIILDANTKRLADISKKTKV